MSRLPAYARRIELQQTIAEKAATKIECDAEINECHASTNKNQEEYDKQLLTLSSGLLALSLAFIKDIVPLGQATCRGLLYASYVVLVACIFAVLASYQISNLGLAKAKEHWEDKRRGQTTEFPYGYATFIRVWNVLTGLLFTIGIILTVSFVIVNLHREGTLSARNVQLQEGAQMKTPAPSQPLDRGANIKAPPPPPPQRPSQPPPLKKSE